MTVLVTVQSAGEMTRVRLYERRGKRRLFCSHEGFYQPTTVTPENLANYRCSPPEQDRRGFADAYAAAWHPTPFHAA